MEQLIQSSDLFVMQVEMDVYTGLKKVHLTMTPFYYLKKPTSYKTFSSNSCFSIFCPCSGCFCSSIRRGTAQSSSFLQTLTPGFANAGQVGRGHVLKTFILLFCLFDLFKMALLHRFVRERAFLEHRGGLPVSFGVQTRSSPVHHQWSGICTHPGERQHFTLW